MAPLLHRCLLLLLCGIFCPGTHLAASAPRTEQRYQIAVCDWMILKRQKLGAFSLAAELGADGLEVDMGGLGNHATFDSKLRDPAVQKQFLTEAERQGVRISSIAMSGFYAQSFAEREGFDRMVQDCIDTMVALNVTIAFLPLGVQGDLVKRPELRPVIVDRLRTVARRAEAAKVVIAIETALDATTEAALLDEIGSSAIRSYFNFANALQNGRDLHAELRTLGAHRIAQIHCTNRDGHWLQDDPQVDLPAIKQTLDAMGWSGWLVVERSRDARRPTDVRYNFAANVAYLKRIFQPVNSHQP